MAEENRIMSMPQTVEGHRRPFSALLAAHIVKKPRYESEAVLHEAAVKLISRHQNLSDLLLEASRTPSGPTENVGLAQRDVCLGSPTPPETGTWATPLSGPGGSLIVHALQRQAVELGVPVGEVSAKLVAEKLRGLMGCSEAHGRRLPLNSTQRAELSVLVQSAQELLSHRAFSPSAFCRELWKALENPLLEVVWHFHLGRILTVEYILESEEGAESWLVTELRSLCGGTTEEQGQKEDKEVQKQILTGVVSVLVRAAFQKPQDPGSAQRNISQQCCSVLDDMLSCVLDSLHKTQDQQAGTVIAECWVQVLDSMSCDVTMSDDVLGCFFTHSLTYILTYRPQFKVSHAIAMQSEWCFAKTSRLLTALYRKLSILLSMEKLLSHLQQVLETDEVNWQHVLSFLSTLLVYYPQAQRSLIELLSRLLSSAFEGYDLENMITSFLLARQGALEGPAVFPSYSEWFKMSFGSASGYHGNSKKSIVFLLKFLSDLVPFDPPQYLKVHILYPPYVPVKHRTLLQEYVSLAKTRLADLKVSVDGMGLYEDLSGAAAPVQCQAKQDVDKAVSLFESTGKISTAVMEASIFRRPYFLSRFLPVLLTPRALPAKPDIRMAFIESLRKAEKIPSALYSNYIQACQRERERHRPEERGVVEVSADRQPLERLQDELQDLRHLLLTPGAEEVSAQLARISEALTVLVPEGVDEPLRQTIMEFHVDPPTTSDLENKVINSVLVGFCQIFMDASKINPPNRQGPWTSHFVAMLLGHRKLLMSLLHRLKDLLCNQGASLSAAHILGLAVFFVHLHQCRAICPLVLSDSTPCSEALAAALPYSTGADMSFCLRFCVAAVCYALCRSDSSPDRVHDYVPSSLCKKLLYLVPRLLPGTRTVLEGGGVQSADEGTQEEKEAGRGMWRNITDPLASWKSSVVALWRQPCFLALQTLPDYQLSFAEWVKAELRVQRSTDILSDPERQEYQQWVCQQQYLSVPLNQGGCAGDIRQACSHIFHAIMEFYTCTQTVQTTRCGPPEADSCLPDIVSRLQELVYELEMNRAFRRDEEDQRSFILDVISEKCSVTSESLAVSSELELQQTMHIWSRVVVALPPTVLLSVRSLGDKRRLDLRAFAEHINQRHRNVCVPAGRLPYDITAHFLKGVLTVSLRCDHPSQAVNKLLSRMHQQCPLLLVSVGVWWSRLCPVLLSLWTRLSGGPLPESLQRVADCCAWACSAVKGEVVPPPAVPALLLAACLHHAGKGQRKQCSTRRTLEQLGQLGQLQEQHGLFPVFLLFFWVTDLLSTFLQLQKEDAEPAREHCMEILGYLCDTADWLLLFHPPGPEQGWYNTLAEVTTDGTTRLMPLAFYSLVPKLDTQVLGKMLKVPGFLLTALHSYSALTRLFLDGQTPLPDSSSEQADPLQILSQAKQFLLRTISLSPQTHFSENSSQLKEACGDLDPEASSAVSSRLSQHDFSEEPDFL